ncbi:MAG: S8 family serine peptidase [Fimbriiglobus sp.]
MPSDRRKPQTLPQLVTLEDRTVPTSAAPDRLLVTFSQVVPDAVNMDTLKTTPNVESAEAIGFGIYQVNLKPGTSLAESQARLHRAYGVVNAGLDQKIELQRTPDDSQYSNQGWLNRVEAPAAWNTTTGTGQTIVAVLDTGVDYRHPDLAANIWTNPRELAGNGRDDDGNGFVDDLHGANFADNNGDPYDTDGHGTHVAGILGAAGNNGTGIAGVNWRTRIMPLKFIGHDGGYTSNAVRAMDYAIANGARIINASWGGPGYDPTLAAAISRSRAAGTIIVTSAGNYSSNNDQSPFYPASYSTLSDNVVSVAATDQNGNLASYSNFGAGTVTIAAPGSGIISTLPNSRYGIMSGTSMASPVIAGALALAWDANPNLSHQQLIAKLRESVDTLPSLTGKVQTGGEVNLAKLVGAPVAPPVIPPATPPTVPVIPPALPVDRTGPRVVNAAFRGSRAGVYDRVFVAFNEAINPTSFTNGTAQIQGPTGAVGISAVVPVANTNNTQFTLLFSRAQTAGGNYNLALNPTVRDVVGNMMDQNNDGRGGTTADAFYLSGNLAGTSPVTPPVVPVTPPTLPGFTRSFSAGVPRAIQDRRTTRVEINVTENFNINQLGLTLDLTHARTSDLSIRLTAPTGERFTLFNRRGGTNLSNTTFTDNGMSLASARAPFQGAVRPEQSMSPMVGRNARGVWVVEIFDVAEGVAGTLNLARLNFA